MANKTFVLVEGTLSFDGPVPPGDDAAVYRFAYASTGQETALQQTSVSQASLGIKS